MIDQTKFETVRIRGEGVAPDLLIWRRYKRPAPGVLEAFLDMNPHILPALALGPFLPIGELVRIPIDQKILEGTPRSTRVVRLYGEA